MRNSFLFLLAFVLSACGSAGPNIPKKKSDPAKDPPQGQTCKTTPPDYHRVVINFTKPLPAKMGLKLDIDTSPRVSECASLEQRGPVATLERNGNQVIIGVNHNNAFSTLPNEARFELVDLQNCGANSSTFYKQTASLPIHYKRDYVNGPSCAFRMLGEAQTTPIGFVD